MRLAGSTRLVLIVAVFLVNNKLYLSHIIPTNLSLLFADKVNVSDCCLLLTLLANCTFKCTVRHNYFVCFRMFLKPWKRSARLKLLCTTNIRRNSR